MSQNEVARQLDNRSVPCATGLIKAAHVIEELESGEILEILSKDHFAPTEIGLWSERDGHHVLVEEKRRGVWPFRYHRLLVRKDGNSPGKTTTVARRVNDAR